MGYVYIGPPPAKPQPGKPAPPPQYYASYAPVTGLGGLRGYVYIGPPPAAPKKGQPAPPPAYYASYAGALGDTCSIQPNGARVCTDNSQPAAVAPSTPVSSGTWSGFWGGSPNWGNGGGNAATPGGGGGWGSWWSNLWGGSPPQARWGGGGSRWGSGGSPWGGSQQNTPPVQPSGPFPAIPYSDPYTGVFTPSSPVISSPMMPATYTPGTPAPRITYPTSRGFVSPLALMGLGDVCQVYANGARVCNANPGAGTLPGNSAYGRGDSYRQLMRQGYTFSTETGPVNPNEQGTMAAPVQADTTDTGTTDYSWLIYGGIGLVVVFLLFRGGSSGRR